MSLWLVKDGRQYILDGSLRELPDGIREGYSRRAADALSRREWKTTGEGAKFTGAYDPGDASGRVVMSSAVCGFAEYDGAVYFSERINELGGIYKKLAPDDRSEAIAVSSNDRSYGGIDIFDGRLAAAVCRGAEAHIAVSELPSFDMSAVTEGNTIEADPVWSRVEPRVLYFSSAGLPEGSELEEAPMRMMTPADVINLMGQSASVEKGPSSICRLSLDSGEFTTLLEEDGFDFIRPLATSDGSLYYIKRPYQSSERSQKGCLSDILLFPVRIVKALFGFLSFFSIKYSGSPLSSGGSKAKQRDERQLFIDGNMIDAERELKANRNDPNPGVIPKSWELRRRQPDGRDELICGGVRCYTLEEDGCVVYSNGKHIIKLTEGGAKRLADGEGVTLIKRLGI